MRGYRQCCPLGPNTTLGPPYCPYGYSIFFGAIIYVVMSRLVHRNLRLTSMPHLGNPRDPCAVSNSRSLQLGLSTTRLFSLVLSVQGCVLPSTRSLRHHPNIPGSEMKYSYRLSILVRRGTIGIIFSTAHISTCQYRGGTVVRTCETSNVPGADICPDDAAAGRGGTAS